MVEEICKTSFLQPFQNGFGSKHFDVLKINKILIGNEEIVKLLTLTEENNFVTECMVETVLIKL